MSNPLDQVWAKSRATNSAARGELLTEHLSAVRDAARALQARIGVIPGVPGYFWDCVVLAGLLHDTGKIPAGFQRMVGNPGPPVPWGERHEVYSLGLAAHVLAGLPEDQLDLIRAGIATHHRPLDGGSHHLRGFLSNRYASPELLAKAIGPVDPNTAAALHAWLLAETGLAATPAPDPEAVAEAAYRGLARVAGRWAGEDREGLTAALAQGAVTLADHAASAPPRASTRLKRPPGRPRRTACSPRPTAGPTWPANQPTSGSRSPGNAPPGSWPSWPSHSHATPGKPPRSPR